MSDRLSALLDRFRLQARVFHSGTLCDSADFDAADGAGHIHVLRSGRLRLHDGVGGERVLDTPSLIFYAKPTPHWIRGEDAGAELVCASIRLGADLGNPIAQSLPPVLIVPLEAAPGLQGVLDMLFDEAFHQRCGRQTALDRLSELLILQLLRHCMAAGSVDRGVLAGLGDARLAKALNAIHARPGEAWTLESLAEVSGMSRARFAEHFRQTLGVTPGDYLADWRIGVAKTLLTQGQPVKNVALDVGYGNASALARAFAARHDGESPTAWLARRQ
jgi:AraC-like DNA-binding protein